MIIILFLSIWPKLCSGTCANDYPQYHPHTDSAIYLYDIMHLDAAAFGHFCLSHLSHQSELSATFIAINKYNQLVTAVCRIYHANLSSMLPLSL